MECCIRALALGLSVLGVGATAQESTGKKVLDAMQLNFTRRLFDDSRWDEYVSCMHNASMLLPYDIFEAHSKSWDGMIEYAKSNGTGGDSWGRRGGWLEWNPQPMCRPDGDAPIPGCEGITITEPCDYASNVAYFNSMTTLCAHENFTFSMQPFVLHSLVASFNTLGVGSAFFHGSGTSLGGTMDTTPIAHISLTSYQAAVHSLPRSHVVADCNNRTDSINVNGTWLIANLTNIYIRQQVDNWRSDILATVPLFQSDYYVTFGCTVIMLLRLVLPEAFVTKILPLIAQIMSLNPQDTAFLLNELDPLMLEDLRPIAAGLSNSTRVALFRRSMGTLLKMMYAFLWQEQTFVGPWLTSPEANSFGAWAMPLINQLGDFLTGYMHPEFIKTGNDVYPGCQDCRHKVAHAKWHEQSANALVDLIYLTDDAAKVLLHGNLTDPTEAGIWTHAVDRGCFSGFVQTLPDILQELSGG